MSDTVGAGAEDWDEKAKGLIPKYVRERSKRSVKDMLVLSNSALSGESGVRLSAEENLMARRKEEDNRKEAEKNRKKGVFDGLVIFINGSTHPLVSDHKLKHLLAENGAKLSLHLGRRSVTHVILGKPSGSAGTGAGGGLAGTKIQKEIQRVGGCGVKYVGVDWSTSFLLMAGLDANIKCRALESIKRGKRLPEAQFSNLKTAAKSQKSVYSMFKTTSSTEPDVSLGFETR